MNTTTSELSTTEAIDDVDFDEDRQLRYIIVPLVVLVTVMLMTAMVCYMARKRKLDNLRHRLMPLYNFDKNEQESDWETEFLNTVDNPNYTETSFKRYED